MKKVRKALECCWNCELEDNGCVPANCGQGSTSCFEPKSELEAELKAAEEALEKQKAKKQSGYTCPTCSHQLEFHSQQYCDNCGQKLEV